MVDESNEVAAGFEEEPWLLFEQDALRALDEAEQHLLALEGGEDAPDDLNGLYRALHSLKGNARVMGLEILESLTHRTEDLVGLARDGIHSLGGDGLELVLETMDVLRDAIPDAVTRQGDIISPRVEDLVERLRALVQALDVEGTRSAATAEDWAVFDSDFGVLDFELPAPAGSKGPSDDRAPAREVEPPATEAEGLPGSSVEGEGVPDSGGEGERLPYAKVRGEGLPDPSVPPLDTPEAAFRPRADASDAPAPRKDTLIQVRSTKIQELLAIASDLGLSVDSLLAHAGVRALNEGSEEVHERALRLRRLMRDLRFAAAGLALVPVSELFAKVRRVARDLARKTGKTFDVLFDGDETEIDKSLVDALGDPVLHIIRNAVDHGLEDGEGRARAKKPARGQIRVSATYSGNEVALVIADDGRGLDVAAIRQKGLEKGLIAPGEELGDDAIRRLIFRPGFSTRDEVSELSGRGVGMDVVAESIKALRGRVELESIPARGTRLSLYLPLTLAFGDALVVESGPYVLAVPLERVGRIFVPTEDQWVRSAADGLEYLDLAVRSVPVVRLHGSGGSEPAAGGRTPEPEERSEERRRPVVTVRAAHGEVALPVDVLRGTEQITIRPLDRFSRRNPLASSCGILGSGEVVMTLDCDRLDPTQIRS